MKLLNLALVATAAIETVNAQGACSKISSISPGKPLIRSTAQRKYFLVPHAGKYTYNLKPNPNAKPGEHSHSGGGGKGGMMGGGGMMGEGDSQSFMANPTGSTFCGTCTVLSGQIKIFYEDGTPANVSNGIYVHHILTNGAAKDAGPSFVRLGMKGMAGASGNGFVGAGDDNGNRPWVYAPKTNTEFESGYQLSPAMSFNAQIVLVNYNKTPKTVCIAYDLEYLPGHVGKRVKATLISSAGITGPPARMTGPYNTTGDTMAFQEAGYIVSAKGHLHDGGVAMFMKIGGKHNYNCVSRATYGSTVGGSGQKTISDMSECQNMPVRVDIGDTMRLTAEYDLKSHSGRQTGSGKTAGLMGMMRVIFAPDRKW
jgi:hypothetical protein